EIIGVNFSRFFTDEARSAGSPCQALEVAARQGRFEAEDWRVRKDGTPFWTHVIIDPIRDPDGKLIGYAQVTRDLSEKNRAEDVLADSEEQFRRLVLNVVDYAIYMLSPTGHVSSWNMGAEGIKGYSAEQVVGKHFSLFYPDEDRARGAPDHNLQLALQ